MKKTSLFAIALVGLATSVLTACGPTKQNDNNTAADSTTVAADTEAPAFVLTAEGIAPVTLGATIADLPESVDGLYARKAFVETEDSEEADADAVDGWYFYDDEDNVQFTAEDNGQGAVGRIIVRSPYIKTAQGAYVGMTAAEVGAIEGIVKDDAPAEADFVQTTYTLNGVSIALDWDATAVASMSVERWQ